MDTNVLTHELTPQYASLTYTSSPRGQDRVDGASPERGQLPANQTYELAKDMSNKRVNTRHI